MDYQIALANLYILENLDPDIKLTVKSNGTFKVDNRWMNGVRRAAAGDSKKDLLEPIEQTFITLINHHTYDISQSLRLTSVLKHLKDTFTKTYPGFDNLQTRLEKLITENKWQENLKNTGMFLNNRLTQREYAVSNGVKETDASSCIDAVVRLHKVDIPPEDLEKVKKLYENVYAWYLEKNGNPLPKFSRIIIYNVLVSTLGLDVDTFVLLQEFQYSKKQYAQIVQDYILNK